VIQRAILFIWLSVLACPAAALACTCSNAPPGACAGLQKGDVVFLGTVTATEDVEPAPSESTSIAVVDRGEHAADSGAGTGSSSDANASANTGAPVTRYHFRIDERFAGPETTEIDIFSGGDDGDCGYRFKTGEQYIVFTQPEAEGRSFATICNGTRLAGDGRALLPQLRAMRNGQRVASVFGVLRRADPPFLAPPDDPDDPLPKIALKLRSRDDRFSTTTGPDGIYSFYDVHAGEYRFTATLPARMELTQRTLSGGLPPFVIPNGACYEYDVDALPTGRIHGSVLGADGKPLPLASVELYRAGQYQDSKPGLWAFQSSKGSFDFDHVGPGEYILVFNRMNRTDPNSPFPRSFYPGTAEAGGAESIILKDGQQLSKVNIKLQEGFPTRQVRVYVKWQHGKPPGDVTIMAKAEQGNNPAARKVSDGLYEFTLLESDRYSIYGWENLLPQRIASRGGNTACIIPERIETPPVTIDGSDKSTKEITLSFANVECGKQ
jgi:hypothetical protein